MSEYEFTRQQNQVFDALATSLRRFAIVIAAFSLVLTVFGVISFGSRPLLVTLGVIGAGVLSMVLAYLFMQPLDNFRRITATQGRDITEFLTALNDLNKAHSMFRLIVLLFVLGQAGGLIAFVMA